MGHWVPLIAFLLAVATAQELLCTKSVDLLPPKGRPKSLPTQKVLYVNILPGYDADMRLGFEKLRDLVKMYYPASTVDFYALTPSATVLPNLDAYTQIWVADLAPRSDNSPTQMASYAKVSAWYKAQGTPHLIMDGRWISSLWSVSVYGKNEFRPNVKLIENYFVNLAVRGGGLALLTDHADAFTNGINEINKGIGVGNFYGFFYSPPYLMQIDIENPVMSWPNDPSHHNKPPVYNIFDDSSTSYTPVSEQKNGVILYPVGWHGLKGGDNPGISTTIRGNIGFLIDITSPTCGARIGAGLIKFAAKITKGGTGAITWSWTSTNGGNFASTQNPSWNAPIGFHVVTVTARDSQKFVAQATVSFRIDYNSGGENGGWGANGDGTCYFVKREGKSANEVFPISRVATPTGYYNLKAGNANTPDGIEDSKRALNFFLYTNSKTLAFETILSPPTITSSLVLSLKGSGLGDKTALTLENNLADSINWNPKTQIGSASWTHKFDTKGFVIEGLPMAKGVENNWCIDVTISKYSQIDYFSDYSHAKSSPAAPNTSPIYRSVLDLLFVPSFSYCRATCFAPGSALTAPFGSFGPIKVDWLKGTGGLTYADNIASSWIVRPSTGASAGIGFTFINTYDVAVGDSLNVFNGEKETDPKVGTSAPGKTAPSPVKTTGTSSLVSWKPNKDGVTGRGWIIFYSIIPTAGDISPISGPQRSHSWVTIKGTNFVKTGRNVVKFGPKIVVTDQASIIIDSPTSMRVNVPPPGPQSMKQYIVDVEVSNDGSFFAKSATKYTFFEGTCKDITTCGDCFNVVGCTCISTPASSYCFASSENSCPKDEDHAIHDDCSDAPNFTVTVEEGRTVQITFIRQRLLDTVTEVKILSKDTEFKGLLPTLNKTTRVLKTNEKGQAAYGAVVYLTGTNNQEKFTYEISGPGIKSSGVVTVIVTPVSKDYLLDLLKKDLEDECNTGRHNCEQKCVDGTPIGSYVCGCSPGFKLVQNRFCEDINECLLDNHGCQFNCTNLPGTYRCECNYGYAKDSNGICQALDCPMTPWETVILPGQPAPVSLNEMLPGFTQEATQGTRVNDWKQIPGANCYSCSGDLERRRAIDHTRWNGSPRCAADSTALSSRNICGYPCKPSELIELGTDAVEYLFDEFSRWEWLQKALLTILDVPAFIEEPDVDGTLDEISIMLSTCDKLDKSHQLIQDLVSDLLPDFYHHGQVKINSHTDADGKCGISITIDDLVEECKVGAKLCFVCDAIDEDPSEPNTSTSHPFCSTDTCGYPCMGTALFYGANAAQFVYNQINHADWFVHALQKKYNITAILELPKDIKSRDYMWNDFFVDLTSECDQDQREKVVGIVDSLLHDVLPEFTEQITVEPVDLHDCRIHVIVDDIPDKTYSIGQTAGIAVGAAAGATAAIAGLAGLAKLLGAPPGASTTDYVSL